MRTRENLGETENIRLYLVKGLRRLIVNEITKSRKITDFNESKTGACEIVFSVEEQIIKNEVFNEKRQTLKSAILSLNSRQQEILYYKFTCGFDYEEICGIMDINYASARQLVSRAIQTLKKVL
jgi:RNA polymerase sigma factor (sigma-70 family)